MSENKFGAGLLNVSFTCLAVCLCGLNLFLLSSVWQRVSQGPASLFELATNNARVNFVPQAIKASSKVSVGKHLSSSSQARFLRAKVTRVGGLFSLGADKSVELAASRLSARFSPSAEEALECDASLECAIKAHNLKFSQNLDFKQSSLQASIVRFISGGDDDDSSKRESEASKHTSNTVNLHSALNELQLLSGATINFSALNSRNSSISKSRIALEARRSVILKSSGSSVSMSQGKGA